MPLAKLRTLLRSWALALALSAALVAAGERWPQPLPIQPPVVWSLVLLPPLLMAALLLWRWPRLQSGGPAAGRSGAGGASGEGGESGH